MTLYLVLGTGSDGEIVLKTFTREQDARAFVQNETEWQKNADTLRIVSHVLQHANVIQVKR